MIIISLLSVSWYSIFGDPTTFNFLKFASIKWYHDWIKCFLFSSPTIGIYFCKTCVDLQIAWRLCSGQADCSRILYTFSEGWRCKIIRSRRTGGEWDDHVKCLLTLKLFFQGPRKFSRRSRQEYLEVHFLERLIENRSHLAGIPEHLWRHPWKLSGTVGSLPAFSYTRTIPRLEEMSGGDSPLERRNYKTALPLTVCALIGSRFPHRRKILVSSN